MWLPGDQRGHWSEAWDKQIGLIEPRQLHAGDAIRKRMAAERMTQPPTLLSHEMGAIIDNTISQCCKQSDWSLAAITIQPTHMHLLITHTTRNIDHTVKWIADQTTKAIHQQTPFQDKVWAKGRWLEFISEQAHWERLIQYIERHNQQAGPSSKR